ncbi:MAG: glycosyltransferase family 2 protein [Candidatus Korarchaeota archaeon]|nr:glycosyltransferase family 2 protein [Candidatus Korarchaeota archaeon]
MGAMVKGSSSGFIEISVIIPAYNEEFSIKNTIEKLAAILSDITNDWEIIVVDDGSDDHTWGVVLALQRVLPQLIAVRLTSNMGKGYALRRGFMESRGKIIMFLDADGDIDPSMIPLYLRVLSESRADVVIGSKRHADSVVTYPSRIRYLASRVFSALARIFLGIPYSDTQTGMKIFKKYVLNDILPLVTDAGFVSDSEMLAIAHKAGFRVIEVPVIVNYSSKSTVTLTTILSMLISLIKLSISLRTRRITRSIVQREVVSRSGESDQELLEYSGLIGEI